MSAVDSKENRLPLILFFTAFVIRLIYLIDYSHSPFFQVHVADAMFHEAWAKRILDGDIFSLRMSGVLYKAPFYPYFIALNYLISGSSNDFLMFVQVLLTAFSCVLLFLIGRRPLGDAAAFVGAMMYNLYFPSVYFSTEMEIPAVAIFLTLLSFYLGVRYKKILPLVGAAILYGFSVSALPSNFLLWPLFLFSIFKEQPEREQGMKRAALFAAVAALTVLPCTVRNAVGGGRFVPVSANGGINFYIGNNEHYDDTVSMQPGYKFEAFYDEPGRVAGASSIAKRNDYWYRKAFHFIATHPAQSAFLVFKKLVLYLSNYEIYRNSDLYFAKSNSIYRFVPFVPASVLLALGGVGAGIALRRRKSRGLFAFGVLLAMPCIFFFVTVRYRLPSMAIGALFAGYAVVTIFEAFRKKQWTAGIALFACATGFAALSNLNCFVLKNPEYRPYLNLGFIYESQAENDRAIEAYRTALRLLETSSPRDVETESELCARIGNVLMSADRLDAAEESFRKAVEADPKSAPAHAYLGSLYALKKEYASAVQSFEKALEINPRDVPALHAFGRLYLDNRELDKAATLFRRALKVAPENAAVYRDLAIVCDLQGNTERMESASKQAIYLDPKNAAARYNLASMYYRTGRIGEAVRQYERIIEKMPKEAAVAYTRLGVISAQRNELPRAIEYWKKALEIDPTDRNAQINLLKAEAMTGGR